MNKDILSLIQERNIVYKNEEKSKRWDALWIRYRVLRNQREVKKAKLDYLQNKIEENKPDSKRIWQNLNSLGLKNKKRKEQESVFAIDGELCHDKMAIANEFNSHFTNVANKLVNNPPPPPFQRPFQRRQWNWNCK